MPGALRIDGRIVRKQGRAVRGVCGECCGDPPDPVGLWFRVRACRQDFCGYTPPEPLFAWIRYDAVCAATGTPIRNDFVFRAAGLCWTADSPAGAVPFAEIPDGATLFTATEFPCVGPSTLGTCDSPECQVGDLVYPLVPCVCSQGVTAPGWYVCAGCVWLALSRGECWVTAVNGPNGTTCLRPDVNDPRRESELPPGSQVYTQCEGYITSCCKCCGQFVGGGPCEFSTLTQGNSCLNYSPACAPFVDCCVSVLANPLCEGGSVGCCCDLQRDTGTFTATLFQSADSRNLGGNLVEDTQTYTGTLANGVWSLHFHRVEKVNGAVVNVTDFDSSIPYQDCDPLPGVGAGWFGPGFTIGNCPPNPGQTFSARIAWFYGCDSVDGENSATFVNENGQTFIERVNLRSVVSHALSRCVGPNECGPRVKRPPLVQPPPDVDPPGEIDPLEVF